MKLSARNVLPAKQSAEALGLRAGAKAYAIIKASNVMIGVD